jgi:hypothetical protein
MASGSGYTRLRRVDLKGFDQRAQNIVLMAMERGGVGRISNRGHAILQSPTGETMSVSKNTGQGNRGLQNMEADFKRCFADLPVENATQGGLALAPQPPPPLPDIMTREPDLPCPVESCEAVFVTEGARYSHVHDKHHPCKEPGCQRVFDTANKAAGHYNLTHGLTIGPTPCDVKGCSFVAVSKNGLGIHKAKSHKPKPKPKKKAVPRKAVAPRATSAEQMLARIREIVSVTSPREAELQQQLEAANARIAELEEKLARIRKDVE